MEIGVEALSLSLHITIPQVQLGGVEAHVFSFFSSWQLQNLRTREVAKSINISVLVD
jgi:hypothetical protein